ncbi:hypothetical protein ACWDSJ_15550 [Nocardia sp. NPDC003482]
MAGDQEPPIRYRGEPPRYRERVVDPENPAPVGRGARRGHDDGWDIEAYTPGDPRSALPADWDDAPVRPTRRDLGAPGDDRESPPARRGSARSAPPDDPGDTPPSRRGSARSAHPEPEVTLEVPDEMDLDGLLDLPDASGPSSAEALVWRPGTGKREAPQEFSTDSRIAEPPPDRPEDEKNLPPGLRGAVLPRQTGVEPGVPEEWKAVPSRRVPGRTGATADTGKDRPRRGARAEGDETTAGPGTGLRGHSGAPNPARPERDPADGDRAAADDGVAAAPRSADLLDIDTLAGPVTHDPTLGLPDGRNAARANGIHIDAPGADASVTGHRGAYDPHLGHENSGAASHSGGISDTFGSDPRGGGADAEARGSDGRRGGVDAGVRADGPRGGVDAGTRGSDGRRGGFGSDHGRGAGRPGGRGDGSGGVAATEGFAGDSRRGVADGAARGTDRRRGSGRAEERSGNGAGRGRSGQGEAARRRGGQERGAMRDDGRAAVRRREGEQPTERIRARGDGDRVRGNGSRGGTRRSGADRGAYARSDRGRGSGQRGRPVKPKRQGPPLLDDATRARYEAIARERAGLRAAWAAFRLRTDDLRRVNAAARIEAVVEDGFDRETAPLTDRGYAGAGGGRMSVVGRPVEYRATTAQVAGLWPWSVGAGAPLIGTPLGSHLHTGAPVCFDPMNWFMRGSFITAPSLFVLGLNGFGKSSLVRRIVLGGVAQGITPLILADVKPDYRKLVELVGGQVIDLGYGHGKLNPLAAGVLGSIVPMLNDLPALQIQVTQEMRARQVTLIAGLVELVRGARVRDYEETLISTALRILYREGSGYTPDNPPIMENLLEVIVGGGEELMLDAGADNPEEYHEATKGLRRSLRALTQGPFGAIFNGQTTAPIDTSAVAVCIDVSHIPNGDKKLKAAVMLACWADGFASVEAAHVVADAELGPQRYFQVVMDELWQVLGLGDFMIDRVDELTRLNRTIATALIMISHTIKDLQALGSEAAIAKALGFLERARAKIFGALPPEEIKRLDSTVPFTAAEEEMVTSWSAPQALTGEALKPGQIRPPAPGTGKFLLKIGEDRRPGIPFHMEFTMSEKASGIHETNQRFSEFTESTARRGDEGSAA